MSQTQFPKSRFLIGQRHSVHISRWRFMKIAGRNSQRVGKELEHRKLRHFSRLDATYYPADLFSTQPHQPDSHISLCMMDSFRAELIDNSRFRRAGDDGAAVVVAISAGEMALRQRGEHLLLNFRQADRDDDE